jgi:hypothetical protein
MVVRDNDAPRVEIERAPYRASQGNAYLRPLSPDVEIFGDVEPLSREEEEHHAFLPAAAEPAHEVLTEGERVRIGGLSQQDLAGGGFRQTARAHYGRGNLAARTRPRAGRIAQRFDRGRIDRPQRTEARDQAPRDIVRIPGGIWLDKRRQDG